MLVKIGKGLEMDVDTGALPDNAMEHVVYIGLRNILMDAHAGITDEDEATRAEKSLAVSKRKLEALMQGVVRVVSERETDPVRQMALDMAERQAYRDWKAMAGRTKEDKFDNPRKRAAEHLAEHPELLKMAEAVIG